MMQLFSAPGRVEIGGNHTDHQHGRVLAAAVDLSVTAVAGPNGTNTVRLKTNYRGGVDTLPDVELSPGGLEPRPEEKGTSQALVRGVAAWFAQNGYPIGGFDADIDSGVPPGAGLSSSAAFETLIGRIFKGLFGAEISPVEIALAGQFAENVYFGKPCGLMDQLASGLGGINMFDFFHPLSPGITPINADFSGYSLCVVDTGGSHVDLTPDYAAVPEEMKAVAGFFGKEFLADVHVDDFYASLRVLRKLGDRAVLRACHFFEETERVSLQASALERGDMGRFFELVIESGRSSAAWLQNVYSPSSPAQQGLNLALCLSEKILADKGAWRVHGGGFAGTTLAFVPDVLRDEYSNNLSAVFGKGCCRYLNVS